MSRFAANGAVLFAAALGADGLGFGFGATAALTFPAVAVIAGGLTIGILVTRFATALVSENRTVLDIQSHHEQQNLRISLDDETLQLEKLAESHRAAEQTQIWMSQELEAEEARREVERARAEEEEVMARRRDQADQELRDQQATLADEQERLAEREQKLQQTIEATRQRLEEKQKTAPTSVQPIQWPSEADLRAAKEKVQYSETNFHFAIVGKAGCGKSSLINAFMNLSPTDAGAARTGITETTLEIGRYPDPGTKDPRPWTVWFDVPGAGTQRIPQYQYFTRQALFVFDIIILVIGDRFEETDCDIVRSCTEFHIPFFIVRSKADQHITNMMRDEAGSNQGPMDSGDLYQTCRQSFIERSKQMVRDELELAGLPVQTVYCVSKGALRTVYNDSLEETVDSDDGSPEMALVKELMLAAYQRRCGSGKDRTGSQLGASIQEVGCTIAPGVCLHV